MARKPNAKQPMTRQVPDLPCRKLNCRHFQGETGYDPQASGIDRLLSTQVNCSALTLGAAAPANRLMSLAEAKVCGTEGAATTPAPKDPNRPAIPRR